MLPHLRSIMTLMSKRLRRRPKRTSPQSCRRPRTPSSRTTSTARSPCGTPQQNGCSDTRPPRQSASPRSCCFLPTGVTRRLDAEARMEGRGRLPFRNGGGRERRKPYRSVVDDFADPQQIGSGHRRIEGRARHSRTHGWPSSPSCASQPSCSLPTIPSSAKISMAS